MRAFGGGRIFHWFLAGRAAVFDLRDRGIVFLQRAGKALVFRGGHEDQDSGQRIGLRVAAAIRPFPFPPGGLGDANRFGRLWYSEAGGETAGFDLLVSGDHARIVLVCG